jgi:hypothetical protein
MFSTTRNKLLFCQIFCHEHSWKILWSQCTRGFFFFCLGFRCIGSLSLFFALCPRNRQLLRDKDPLLRYGGVYTLALAYVATSNNSAIRRLLHLAVSGTAAGSGKQSNQSYALEKENSSHDLHQSYQFSSTQTISRGASDTLTFLFKLWK